MTPVVLALNVGSSSLKLAAFDAASLRLAIRAAVSGIGSDPRATVAIAGKPDGRQQRAVPGATDAAHALDWLMRAIRSDRPDLRIAAVGHRVVHGGTRFTGPVRVDAGVIAALEELAPLAPAHQPAALAVIRRMQAVLPAVPQVACFDTAFHRTQARVTQWFALPRRLSEAGLVRIGFNGLSYEYIAGALAAIDASAAAGSVVVAHLGHGASVCAMRNGQSVSTSMGFTPLDGLMMSTRCGTLDPGVVLYLQQQRGMGTAEVADLLGNQSGLLGVSGLSGDMRVLEASDDPRAREAVDMFAERAASAIAAQCVPLGGLDALVFTAGIGEHSAGTRERICARLAWLGVEVEPAANANHARRIDGEHSRVRVFVIPTDEESVIAQAARALAVAG